MTRSAFFKIFFLVFLAPFLSSAAEPDDLVLYGKNLILLKEDSCVSGGSVVSGKNFEMQEGAQVIGDVFVGLKALINPSATIDGTFTEGISSLPDVTISHETVSPGSENVFVSAGVRRVLKEGAYKDITVEKGGVLVLAGGTYFTNGLTMAPGSKIVLKASTVITSALPYDWGARNVLFQFNQSPEDFILYTSSELPSILRKGSYFEGLIYSPNAEIRLRKEATVIGTIKALGIRVSSTAKVKWSLESEDCFFAEEGTSGDSGTSDEGESSDGSGMSDGSDTSGGSGTTTSGTSGSGSTDSGSTTSGGSEGETGDNSTTGSGTTGGDTGLSSDDPANFAPSIDPTVSTTLGAATEFLYTGTNPIQTGVSEGTIDVTRVSIIRGKVTERDGAALSGVKITLLDHSEFGSTFSRSDGMFDIAVNGGSWLTVVYEKDGYLPVQRKVNSPWQNFVWAEDVAMIPVDSEVTEIDLSGETTTIQVAQGSESNDTDGTRTATLLFPAGTQATMTLDDGSTETLTTLNVRATEYTLGEDGLKAMPATLPANSAYTYAVELSVDEAMSAGATSVNFNQKVYFYVENFLEFPVGEDVPAGFYDKEKSEWVPSESGVIIKILGDLNGDGKTEIDSDGDDVADSAATLASLSFTDEEREKLTTQYVANQTLWRVPLTHFSIWDLNWGIAPPDDAIIPNQNPNDDHYDDENKTCIVPGSIIECQNQTLGETLPISGTPFSLNYRSSRVPGRVAGSSLDVKVTGDYIPASLKSVVLNIEVAGRLFNMSLPAKTNQSYSFNWDGLDAYGRKVQGAQETLVRIGYVYDGIYKATSQFGYSAGSSITGTRGRIEIILWQNYTTKLVVNDQKKSGAVGGWSVSSHHVYDVGGQTLYLGDGTKQNAEGIADMVQRVAGANGTTTRGDNGPATKATLQTPQGITLDNLGNLYITQTDSIRKVDLSGTITTIAGIAGSTGYSGDGGLATNAMLKYPKALALDGKGNLFVADTYNQVIRKIDPSGIITTVAGTGSIGFSGDGGLATKAGLYYPEGLAVDPDGNLFIADSFHHTIRKVDTAGIITTVAGISTSSGYSGDGGQATDAKLNNPYDVALDTNGNLFIADGNNHVIRKVDTAGVITTVAGTGGSYGYSGDGAQATDAKLYRPYAIAIDTTGNLFIADTYNHSIRKVDSSGVITTIAGDGSYGYNVTDGVALKAQFYYPKGLAIDQNRNIYIADSEPGVVRKIGQVFSGFNNADISVASEDGTELYLFNSVGQHQKTFDTKTKTTLYTFGYDANNLLVSITDEDANTTTIHRNSDGTPTSIEGPYGQTTKFTLDDNGYLKTFTDPAGQTYIMKYSQTGLLTSFQNPEGNTSTFAYDNLGRLTEDANALGYAQILSRESTDNGYQVTLTSPEGIIRNLLVETDSKNNKIWTNTLEDGTKNVATFGADSTDKVVYSDGTVYSLTKTPDPRFGMQAPFLQKFSITTPAGLQFQYLKTRTVTLADSSDLLGLTNQTDTETVNGKTYTTFYDAASYQETITTPESRKFIQTFDAKGKLIKEKVGSILEPSSYTYDANGRLSTITYGTTNPRTYTLTYHAEEGPSKGLIQSITDPLLRITTFEYDAAGRVITETGPDGKTIGYTYDANGNLTSITPPSQPAHEFTYNSIDLESSYTSPNIGLSTHTTEYSYNKDKQLSLITRPDGKTIDYIYDSAGRIGSVNADGDTTTYEYSTTTGLLTSITDPSGGSLAFTYDGDLLLSSILTGDITGSVGFTYTNDFWVSKQTINGTTSFSFEYDNDGLLTKAGNLSLTRSSDHGLITNTTLSGITSSLTYSGLGEIKSENFFYSGSSLYSTTFTRDDLGRITDKTVINDGTTIPYTYSYDTAGRLETATYVSSATTYTYDDNGNRLTKTKDGVTTSATYDDQDRLKTYGDNTYTYTDNGELLTKTNTEGTTTYEYDILGNLKSASLPDGTEIEYVIDGQNRRVGKKINGTQTQGLLYKDQLEPVAELDGNNNIVSTFIYASKSNVPDYMVKAGTTYRIISDHLGSVNLVVNTDDGNVVQEISYDEFGNILSNTNPGFQPFGFAGGIYDADTKLTRFGARDYDAETGRWTLKDPIGFNGGDSNLYVYIGNDPMNHIDPYGKEAITGGAIILGGLAETVFLFGSAAVSAIAIYEFYHRVILDDHHDCILTRDTSKEREEAFPDEDCNQEWADAYKMCDEYMNNPKLQDNKKRMTGGYSSRTDCAKGFVSEACGGSPTD